jgi:translocation and assembly module TamB
MTTSDTRTSRTSRGDVGRQNALPSLLPRHRKADWGRTVARVFCSILALVGALPFVATFVVRSAWARDWAARESERLLHEQGLSASYANSLRIWPLAVELDRIRVEATDGGGPAVVCDRALVRPRLFALLAGKLAIDEIDLDGARVRAVVRDGQLQNLALKDTGAKRTGPLHAPFNTFSVTDASVDLDLDGMTLEARSLDVDVTADDDPALGASFEVALHTGRATVHRQRPRPEAPDATDDDALCSVEGRLRIEPDQILIRRFDGVGSADLDAEPGTTPPCDLPTTDKRRVEVSLSHLHVQMPQGADKPPHFDGHVRMRAPIGLAERAVSLPETDGWVGIDVDVRYADDTILPDLSGSLEAHNVRLDQYAFADDLKSEVSIRGNIVESPTTTIRFAGGTVTLSDTVVAPLAKGAKIERTRLDAAGVDFTSLLRTLGVHPNSWVAWELREVHAPLLSGTIVPLKIDGDVTAKTYSFGIFDRPAEDHARERLFGFSEAQIATHVSIRPDALKFVDVHATLPRSRVDGALVSIGFHDELRVETPSISADLDDISPIGPVPIHGKAQLSAHVGGVFNHPEPAGDIQSIAGFVVSDVSFGDLSGGHVAVDVTEPVVQITNAHAKKGGSAYDVPTAKLQFGGTRGFRVDAVGATNGFGFRDLLSMFALDDDPRFDGLDGKIAARTDVHVALGGPEDACGGGYVEVATKGHLTDVLLYGERFAQGDADVGLRWYDRQRGIAGADVEVRSFVLEKVRPPSGTRAAVTGTVLGSASIRRGGALAANVMLQGIPLSRVDSLGKAAQELDGSVSGVAHVSGNLDDFQPDAGFVARAEIDVSGARARGVALANSHLDVRMTQSMPPPKRTVGRTRCGAPIAPAFDKQAYLADTSSHGEWSLNGSLLGDTVRLSNVVVTRAKSSHLTGRVSLRALDLGLLSRLLTPARPDADESAPVAASAPIGGELWAEVIANDIPLDAPDRANVQVILGPTFVARAGRRLTLKPPREPVTLVNDTLAIPPLEMVLDTDAGDDATRGDQGFRGGFVLSGGVKKVSTDPTLALEARLEPVDLAILPRLVPKVDRASGRLEGNLRLTGRAMSPTLAGELHAAGDDVEIHGLPSAITDVKVDVQASSSQVSATGQGKFAGGTVAFDATVPLRGFEVGGLASKIVIRGIHLAPEDGVSATLNADLALAFDPKGQATGTTALPRLTGDVTLVSMSYTRPITLNADLASLATRAKRTVVSAYDPSLDFVTLDLRLRSSAPMVIKNNLVEVQLAIDSGTLEVTGTNQRIGLRGTLRTLPGGRFHFQTSDFDLQQGIIRFDDATRIAPNVDITAVTEYRRYTDSSAGGAAAGAGATGGPAAASASSTRGGSLWRITLHAYGDAENLKVDMTSEPALSQEDIVLLLTVGMTRAELDQLQASSIGASIALNYLGAASGADRAVKTALPIIDDFRFGSAYSTVTGKTEPQLTVGKRLTNDVRASVTAGLSEDRELRSNIEWRLNNRLSVQGSYDNINDVSSSALGNLGVDLRWRLEFE